MNTNPTRSLKQTSNAGGSDFLEACPTIELTLSDFEQPIAVDLERFFEFSFDLAEELLDLEAQFKPTRHVMAKRPTRNRQPIKYTSGNRRLNPHVTTMDNQRKKQ